jgi:hypothetical protein
VLAPVAERLRYQIAADADAAHISQTIANRMPAWTVLNDQVVDASDFLRKSSIARLGTKNGNLTGSGGSNLIKAGVIKPGNFSFSQRCQQNSQKLENVVKLLELGSQIRFCDKTWFVSVEVCPILCLNAAVLEAKKWSCPRKVSVLTRNNRTSQNDLLVTEHELREREAVIAGYVKEVERLKGENKRLRESSRIQDEGR